MKRPIMLPKYLTKPEKTDEFQSTTLKYRFQEFTWLLKALNHPSAVPLNKQFERLEFLGDRVLGLAMATLLSDTFEGENEGRLAKRHAHLVSREACLVVAHHMKLQNFVKVIIDEKARDNMDAILADTVEAILGAVFKDGGFPPCLEIVKTFWKELLHKHQELPKEPKSSLQEWVQKRGRAAPCYTLISQTGQAHQPVFIYEVEIEGLSQKFQGSGNNRKIAERNAAQHALDYLTQKME